MLRSVRWTRSVCGLNDDVMPAGAAIATAPEAIPLMITNVREVYLNGEYMPVDKACISPFDRGFIFGDGVYEVIPVYGGRMFRLPQHLKRLEQSLAAVRLTNPYDADRWETVLEQLMRRNGASPEGDQSIYLQITRGVAARDHAFPLNATPTVFAYAQPLAPPSADTLAKGVAAVTLTDIRWQRCDIKATALLANAIARSEAAAQGAVESILIRDGVLTEGAASNIFVVTNGELATPPKGPFILPGITRDLIVELAKANNIKHAERTIRENELRSANEIWMTSSTKEIVPITKLDGKTVGSGQLGPVFSQVHTLYQQYKRDFCAGKVD